MMINKRQDKSPDVALNKQTEEEAQVIIVADKYIIEKKIGRGSFGEVYQGFDKNTKEKVAIKLELAKTFSTRALIEEGIPKLHFCGTEGDYNVLVLQLLGPNLEDVLGYMQKRLSLKTVLMISDQLIQRMETIHNRGFLHRDIKSDNFLIGAGPNINKVYAIDFGLAKRYVHPHTFEHILMKKHKGLIGTARYASINAHLGLEQGRRDDLQALGYLIIYLAKGSLPWQNIKSKSKQQKYKKIMDMKDSYTPEALAVGLPEEFASYLNYVKKMEFEEKPDYQLLRGFFISVMNKLQIHYDNKFDWMISGDQRQSLRKKIRRKVKQVNKDKEQKEIEIHKQISNQSSGNENQIVKTETTNNIIDIKQNEKTVDTVQSQDLQIKNFQEHILEKPYMQIIDEENLPQISEQNEEIVSRKASGLQDLNLQHRFLSDVNLLLTKNQSQFSAKKIHQKVNRAISMKKKESMEKLNRLCLPDSGVIKLQNLQNSDIMLDEILGDVEEDLEVNNNLGLYQFTNKNSILQTEKTVAQTPSPVKRRTLIGFKPSLTFNDYTQNFRTPNILVGKSNELDKRQGIRQIGRSCDNQMPYTRGFLTKVPNLTNIKHQEQQKSSNNTEYNESSSYFVQIKKLRNKLFNNNDQPSHNTSSEDQDCEILSQTRKRQLPEPSLKQSDLQAMREFINQEKAMIQQLKQSRQSQESEQEQIDLENILDRNASKLSTVKNLLIEQRKKLEYIEKSKENQYRSSSSSSESNDQESLNQEENNDNKIKNKTSNSSQSDLDNASKNCRIF